MAAVNFGGELFDGAAEGHKKDVIDFGGKHQKSYSSL